jgi:hypothetical protein
MSEFSDYMKKLEAIYKAAATDFKVNGVLTDQQTIAWMTHVFEKDAFLKRVGRQLRAEYTGNTGFIEGSDQVFVRVEEGNDDLPGANEGTYHTQRFSKYALADLDVHAFIGYSVVDDNPTAGLLEKINQVLDQSVANSFLNLACNGTTDVYAAAFLTLAKGWIQLAKDSVTINKVLLVPDDERLQDLDVLVMEMLLELPQEHREGVEVIMSDNERLRRINRIAETTSGDARSIALAAMTPEMKNNIHGKPITTPHYWPDGVIMLAKPGNLEVDVHKVVRREIKEVTRRKGFEYTYLTKADFEIIHHAEACVAYIPA